MGIIFQEKVNMKNYLRYFYAILAVPVIVLLRYAIMPLVGAGVPYLTLFPVSVGVALLAGLGPAILTGILGSIAVDYFFIPPLYGIDFNTIDGISRIAIVTLTSAFVGYVGQVLREARSRAEKQAIALRESQTDLNRAQAVANTGSWRLDVRRNELTWSDEAYRIFGVPTGTALTYESFLSFIHPEDREYVDTKWQASLGGEKYDIEHRIIAGDTIKWVREKAELEFDPQGVLLGGFGTVTDITERKQTEEIVRQRTKELEIANQNLQREIVHREQISKELARSNKDLEQFAYVASHDLQEPLRAVAGFVELLRQQLPEPLDAKKQGYMNFIIEAVKRMQTLINGLLEYSRIETRGKEPEPTEAGRALDIAVMALQTSIKESGAKIIAETLPTVNVDSVQMVQLFQNLIGNAIKFRSESAPEIRISASRQGDNWRFAVADNGIGIEPEYVERIFLLFQRLHTRNKYPGTGIGLAICKRIVERHGGKIWVESEPGRGSTFYFTIPRTGDI